MFDKRIIDIIETSPLIPKNTMKLLCIAAKISRRCTRNIFKLFFDDQNMVYDALCKNKVIFPMDDGTIEINVDAIKSKIDSTTMDDIKTYKERIKRVLTNNTSVDDYKRHKEIYMKWLCVAYDIKAVDNVFILYCTAKYFDDFNSFKKILDDLYVLKK